MKYKWLLIFPIAAMFLNGCTKYEWCDYDKKLLSYYKHQDTAKFERSLECATTKAEKCERVPPGLYAEVGYLLFELGEPARAIEYFEKEKALWPESEIIMDKMIRNAAGPDASSRNL